MAHLEIARQYSRQVRNEGFVIVDKIMKEGSVGVMTTHAADSFRPIRQRRPPHWLAAARPTSALWVFVPTVRCLSARWRSPRRRGMRLGLVTNAVVYDASPAAFVCHVPNRRDFTAIINRYLELMPDVIFGGGKEQFLPKSRAGSRRGDEIDMVAAFEKVGYRFVANKADLERTKAARRLACSARAT